MHMTHTQLLIDLWLSPTSIDEELFLQCLTHKSYAMDYAVWVVDHNERLEFLGDSILGAVISTLIYNNFPGLSESKLTLTKIFLVKESTLATVARNIGLGSYMRLWTGEARSGWREKDSVLSDGLESLIAFVYLQYGWKHVEQFIYDHVYALLSDEEVMPTKSPKNQLQEWVQKKYNELPIYENFEAEYDVSGDVTKFGAKVYVDGKLVAEWFGKNKKKAQEVAARHAVQKLAP